jgi:hypothetical protein
MNSKQFLTLGGIILVLLGILGWFVIGPTADDSIFGSTWWFDNTENWAHLVLGIIALLAVYFLPETSHKSLTLIVGAIALLVGLYSIMDSTVLWGANLQNPADTILHLVVGAWAIWAAMKS